MKRSVTSGARALEASRKAVITRLVGSGAYWLHTAVGAGDRETEGRVFADWLDEQPRPSSTQAARGATNAMSRLAAGILTLCTTEAVHSFLGDQKERARLLPGSSSCRL